MFKDWKDRKQRVTIKASVFIMKSELSVEELSHSEELLVTALFFVRLTILKTLIYKKITK